LLSLRQTELFFIADTSDLVEFGEVFQITNTKRMKAGATPEEKINAARKDYFGAA
jgi:hypothetical protein